MTYATTTELAEILGILQKIPSWATEGTPTKEEVGTGDNSVLIFYLDYQNVLASSYTIYYGATADTTTTLTETTHYAIDKDKGKLTLTTAGRTLLDTNKIYSEYSYIDNGMSDSYLATVIGRAESEVDGEINSTFTDGTATNPSYPVETEYQSTEGLQMDRWITKKKPLIDIESALDGDITSTATTLDITAGDGATYPTSGYLIIGSEVISYTGITTDEFTGLTRGALGSTAATHTDLDVIHSTLVFISDTDENTAVSWTIQAWDTDVDITEEGLVYRFKDASPDVLTRAGVQNRFKIVYYSGNDTIPVDITRLTLLFAKRQLIQDNIAKSMIQGRNEFRPEMFNIDINEIKRIINKHIVFPMGNT